MSNVEPAQLLLEEMLCRRLGLEIRSIGHRAIRAAINNRLRKLKLDLGDYASLAGRDPLEAAALIDEVVVPESWFMRDRVPFANLASHARSLVRGTRARTKYRVLSVPCSTGEEPYSVAMAMLDAGIAPEEVTIDAVDVSPPLLELAKRGEYRPISFRGDDLSFRERYFRSYGEVWEISPTIRAMVRFRSANLVAPDFLAGEPPYDAVLCRNLLIYLTADARKTALTRLDSLLAEGGVLVVGHAEALEVMEPRFRAIGVTGAFTYVRRQPVPGAPDVGTTRRATVPIRKMPPARVATPPVGVPKVQRTPPPEPLPPPPPPPPADPLDEASSLADRGLLREAAALCEAFLERNGADGRAWALLGTIRQAEGDASRAESCYSRAIYCDPTHYAAMIQLALLFERRGDRDGAANLRRRAARVQGDGGGR